MCSAALCVVQLQHASCAQLFLCVALKTVCRGSNAVCSAILGNANVAASVCYAAMQQMLALMCCAVHLLNAALHFNYTSV